MSQKEPLAERECNKEKIPGLYSVVIPYTREGAEAKRKPRDTAHLVSRCLHSSQAHTWGNLGIGDQTQAGVRMGKEVCKRPRQQAHTLASLPHYQLLTSCLTKLVKCVFESPYLWEELWGMGRARPLQGPQWPPSPQLCTSALNSQSGEDLQCLGPGACLLPVFSLTGGLQDCINCVCVCVRGTCVCAYAHMPAPMWLFDCYLSTHKIVSHYMFPLFWTLEMNCYVSTHDRLFLTAKHSLAAVAPAWVSFPLLFGLMVIFYCFRFGSGITDSWKSSLLPCYP